MKCYTSDCGLQTDGKCTRPVCPILPGTPANPAPVTRLAVPRLTLPPRDDGESLRTYCDRVGLDYELQTRMTNPADRDPAKRNPLDDMPPVSAVNILRHVVETGLPPAAVARLRLRAAAIDPTGRRGPTPACFEEDVRIAVDEYRTRLPHPHPENDAERGENLLALAIIDGLRSGSAVVDSVSPDGTSVTVRIGGTQ